MRNLLLSLFVYLPIAPLLLAILGAIVSLQLSRRRWIIHAITFVAMVLALPIYIRIEGLVDPTTIQYPGPGDGFVVLLYGAVLLLTVIGYSAFCLLARVPNSN
jgi:hypothetical protein